MQSSKEICITSSYFSLSLMEQQVQMAGWSKAGSVCPFKAYWDKRPLALGAHGFQLLSSKGRYTGKEMFHPFKTQLVWKQWHCMPCTGNCHTDLSLLLPLYDPEKALQQDLIKATPLLWLIREHQFGLCSGQDALIFRERERNAKQLVKQDWKLI